MHVPTLTQKGHSSSLDTQHRQACTAVQLLQGLATLEGPSLPRLLLQQLSLEDRERRVAQQGGSNAANPAVRYVLF
jgi:hypothetical protein